jgi:hypothetical protein
MSGGLDGLRGVGVRRRGAVRDSRLAQAAAHRRPRQCGRDRAALWRRAAVARCRGGAAGAAVCGVGIQFKSGARPPAFREWDKGCCVYGTISVPFPECWQHTTYAILTSREADLQRGRVCHFPQKCDILRVIWGQGWAGSTVLNVPLWISGRRCMVTLEHIVDAVRSLVQDFLASHPILTIIPRPALADGQSMAVAAALVE